MVIDSYQIHRENDPLYYSKLLRTTTSQISDLISEGIRRNLINFGVSKSVESSHIRVVKETMLSGGKVASSYVDFSRINSDALVDVEEKIQLHLKEIQEAWDAGHSIIISRLSQLYSPITKMALQMAKEAGYRVCGNLYLTPPGSQAFAIHFDWMESFVLQIDGMKEWRLYNTPLELPHDYQQFTPDVDKDVNFDSEKVITMQPGSLLYIPSGYVEKEREKTLTYFHNSKVSYFYHTCVFQYFEMLFVGPLRIH